MSKARDLANTLSTGNLLADGVVSYNEVTGTPALATVATSGAYSDLSGTPTLPTGDIVGTSDTQTLTNKTINASSNTISNVSLTTDITGTLSAANGGTGLTSAGTAGNILTSDGTGWVSSIPASGAGAFVAFSSTGGF